MRKARGGSFALWPATRYQGSLRFGNRDQETIGLGWGDPAGFGQKPKEAPPSLLTFVWMDVLKARRYQIRKGKGKGEKNERMGTVRSIITRLFILD